MRTLACATILVVASLAGCGGTGKPAPPSLTEGAQVFASSCSGCHTLGGGGRHPPPGGPLAGYRMTTAQLESFVRTMPVRRPLSGRELRAVVEFVAQAQRAHRESR